VLRGVAVHIVDLGNMLRSLADLSTGKEPAGNWASIHASIHPSIHPSCIQSLYLWIISGFPNFTKIIK
jgi:hypothetical protein